MEEESTCVEEQLQYKLKEILAAIVEACGSFNFGASTHEIVLYFSASAAGPSEENLSDLFTILLENAMSKCFQGNVFDIFSHAIYDGYRSPLVLFPGRRFVC